MSSAIERRAAETTLHGWDDAAYTKATVTDAAAVSLPTTALTDRGAIRIYVGKGETGTLYLRTDGTAPTTTEFELELIAGQSYRETFGADVTVKAIASAGASMSVRVQEMRREF